MTPSCLVYNAGRDMTTRLLLEDTSDVRGTLFQVSNSGLLPATTPTKTPEYLFKAMLPGERAIEKVRMGREPEPTSTMVV